MRGEHFNTSAGTVRNRLLNGGVRGARGIREKSQRVKFQWATGSGLSMVNFSQGQCVCVCVCVCMCVCEVKECNNTPLVLKRAYCRLLIYFRQESRGGEEQT